MLIDWWSHTSVRVAVAILFVGAGVLHFVRPRAYVAIVPRGLPHPAALVAISGIAEIAGGIGLVLAPVRAAAGSGLIILLIAVFPANVQMLLNAGARGAPRWVRVVLWLRLPLQPVLAACVWWAMR